MIKIAALIILASFALQSYCQNITGYVIDIQTQKAIAGAVVKSGSASTITDEKGIFSIYADSNIYLRIFAEAYLPDSFPATAGIFPLEPSVTSLDEFVVSGTMKNVSRTESAIPVLVYNSAFFKCNPAPSLFDALQNVNGVRPQLNCNICNTGDIHINGLEGPYTMILIDGMPLVSGLSTVYGLSGIPQALIDRVEVVKGPASTLYGSEAVGGLINIITVKPEKAPVVSADLFATTWGEINSDMSARFKAGNKAQSLLGINSFLYDTPKDHNGDGFTDVTLQQRISVFNKWSFTRQKNRIFSVAGRYVYEDRWGGQMNYTPEFRGSDSIYAESIYTSRWEIFGTYQLPVNNSVFFQFSANGHNQDSYYGTLDFQAKQYNFFAQFYWNRNFGKHDLTAGLPFRFTYYDDNTVVTQRTEEEKIVNMPSRTLLPGIFLQDEWKMNDRNTLLTGLRYELNSIHGSIFSPRMNYKWNSKNRSFALRAGIGNGYRVANIFTEDHAALTGSRKVEFKNELRPETSWNGTLNGLKTFRFEKGSAEIELTGFYTYFSNKIIPDYLSDANKIIYDNLKGHAVSSGVSMNFSMNLKSGWKVNSGATFLDVYNVSEGVAQRQLFTEKFTATWGISCSIRKIGCVIDYTGNLYSPMKLPLLGPLDPRPEFSPWWSIQNIQLTKAIGKSFEIYGGVKNFLNWTPGRKLPFLIARANDPFDKNVQFDLNGNAVATLENPYALTFDPGYVYGPNQGIRGFAGVRFTVK